MDYREFDVPIPLRRHVQCVWRWRDEVQSHDVQTIFPDGRCELVMHLGQPPRVWSADRGWNTQAYCVFAAQHRAAIRLACQGIMDCIGVRLKPAASAAIASTWLAKSRDRMIDLNELSPDFAQYFAVAAAHFATERGGSELWRLLESRLLQYRIDERIETAVECLEAQEGRGRIESIATHVAMSMRSFQMRFLDCVGLGAKEFACVVRLQATIRALDRGAKPVSRVAFDAGFADQAHATRELRKLTGVTPAQLRAALQRDREAEDTIRIAAAFVRGRS